MSTTDTFPSPGDLFHVFDTRHGVIYAGTWRTVAVDRHVVVADDTANPSHGARRTIAKHGFKFFPVGPEVADALGIKQDATPEV